ncbi:MAG: ABC transporter ATP-binding protein [Gammaproteobacteria bacterium]
MGEGNTIEATGLTRSFGERIAVDNISLCVERGEVLGLLGVNGAGKSTTMDMLAGIQLPDKGEVFINNFSLSDQAMKARACLGYLPEQPPVYPEMTVDEYLIYCAKLRRVAKQKILTAVDQAKTRCGLDSNGKRLIKNLSKGYQQRIGIAQAIVHGPDIVILDEPTVGLDPVQIVEIRKLIRELGNDHSVILSTHILPEVLTVCDRVIIVRQGKVVHEASISAFDQKQFPANETLEQIFIRLTCGDQEVIA